MKSVYMTICSLLVIGSMSLDAQEFTRNVEKYNLVNGIAIEGYDPVSYFPEGGGIPLKGNLDLKLKYQNVIYLFASIHDLNLFVENPKKYEPTYGGYSAHGMSIGSILGVNPLIYTIKDNRIHLFVSKRSKQFFDHKINEYEINADNYWRQISGEEPRF